MSRKTLVSASEARAEILAVVSICQSETVPLTEALGRVLAADVIAEENLPGFDNASMDGYGLHLNGDTASNGQEQKFEVIGESSAGSAFQGNVGSGQSIRIMTGAPVPVSVNAVIEVEKVHEKGEAISVAERVTTGRNIRRKGEDVRSGERVITSGTLLHSFHIGVLAALGKNSVIIARKPRINIVTTGSELVPPGVHPGHGKVRNSSAYLVPAMAAEAGAVPGPVVTVGDDPDELRRSLRESLLTDILVTTGGISAGKYDLVLDTLEGLGVQLKFWKVKIKPGMPMAFGVSTTGVPVFCLAGNPVSTAVTFRQFVVPAIQKMLGMVTSSAGRIRAALQHEIAKRDGKVHFSRGILEISNGTYTVRTTGSQSSGMLSSLVKANCLIVLPEHETDFPKGKLVEVEVL